MEPARTCKQLRLTFLLSFAVPEVLFEEIANRIKAAETFPTGPSDNDANDVFFWTFSVLVNCRVHRAGSSCWLSRRRGRKSWWEMHPWFLNQGRRDERTS